MAFSTRSLYRVFHRMLRSRPIGVTAISEGDSDRLIEVCALSFYSHVIFNLNSMGHKALRQMFYISFATKYYGLSRVGRKLLAKYGFSSTLSYADNLEVVHLEEQRQKIRLVIYIVAIFHVLARI
jgi:hypothetical protein